jgi:hypothetical protein
MSWPQHLVAIVPCNDLNVRAPTPDPRLQLTGRSDARFRVGGFPGGR